MVSLKGLKLEKLLWRESYEVDYPLRWFWRFPNEELGPFEIGKFYYGMIKHFLCLKPLDIFSEASSNERSIKGKEYIG